MSLVCGSNIVARARKMKSNASGLVGRSRRLRRLDVRKTDVECGAHADDDLLLAGREVGDILVEAIGPELRAGLRRAGLRICPQRRPEPSQASFDDVADTKVAPDLSDVLRLATVRICGGSARCTKVPGNVRQRGCQIISDARDQIVVVGLPAEIVDRQHHD